MSVTWRKEFYETSSAAVTIAGYKQVARRFVWCYNHVRPHATLGEETAGYLRKHYGGSFRCKLDTDGKSIHTRSGGAPNIGIAYRVLQLPAILRSTA